MELDPPVPTNANWTGGSPQVLVTFSHPLKTGPLDTANWHVRQGNLTQIVDGVDVTAGIVRIFTHPGGPEFGGDIVNYTPPPYDVISDTVKQVRAEAFLNYPLT